MEPGWQAFVFSFILAFLAATSTAQQQCSDSVIELAFLVDASGSICDEDLERYTDRRGCGNWLRVVNFITEFIDAIGVSEAGSHVGVVRFGNNGVKVNGLQDYYDENRLISFVDNNLDYPINGENTATAAGINTVINEIFTSAESRSGVRKVVVLITDGKPTLPENTANADALAAVARLKQMATVFSIGVTDQVDAQFLEDLSSGGEEDKDWFRSASFEDLEVIREEVIFQTCQTPPPREDDDTGCENTVVDLAIAVDGSGSICNNRGLSGCTNWPLVRNFVADIVRSLDVSPDSARIALLTFSETVSIQFGFNEKTQNEMIDEINNLHFPDSRTNTQLALRVLREDVFNNGRGDRPNVRNVAIVFTDGNPTIETQNTIPFADALRREDNVDVIAVGVTAAINETILRLISSPPREKDRNYFTAAVFEDLQGIINDLVEVACATTPAPTPAPTTPSPAPGCRERADIVFVVDSSGSIRYNNFELMKDFLSDLVGELAIDAGVIRVGLIQFSDNVEFQFDLDEYRNRDSIQDHISGLRYIRGTTNTAAALKYVRENMFDGRNGDRGDVDNIAVVLTDGGSNDKEATFSEAVLAKEGMTIITMGLGDWIDEYELKAIASDSYEQNLIMVSRWSDLRNFVDQMRRKLCNNENECASNPCRNGGTCVDSYDRYYCRCREDYGGVNCEYRCQDPGDVVFAIDSSGSIGKENFQIVVDFVKALAIELPLGSGTRVGLETFSDNERMYFQLDDNNDVISIMDAMSIPYFVGGSTNTDRALQYMRENMFTSNNGDRRDSPNIGVILTDGRSRDMDATWVEAISNRRDGIHMMAIGITDSIRYEELRRMASSPTDDNIWTVNDFRNLNSELVREVRDAICNSQNECSSGPCRNGGQCRDIVGGYYCQCPDRYTGKNCERRCNGEADITFIIDRSGSIRHERFDDVKEFLVDIIDDFEMVDEKTRVAAISFSDDAKLEFGLNTYSTKQDVMEGIRNIAYTGGRTNLASSLEMARTQVFRNDRGDRQDYQNYVIIFTDGGANIRETETIPEAIALRIAGAYIIDMGVGRDINMMELRGMASSPVTRNVITVNSFNDMRSMIEQVIQKICNDEDECESRPCRNGGTCVDDIGSYRCVCPSDRTGENCDRSCRLQYDISFIIDLSGSVDDTYDLSIAFVRKMVYGLQFRTGTVRASLITFSDDARVHFYLDTYQDQRDVLNALSFYQTGGRTNTQEALRLADEEVFDSRRGDRNGVKNVVVLLTDGGSNVNPSRTIERARDLKNRGADIHVIAIGDQVDMNEINSIATNPNEYVQRVDTNRESLDAADDVLDFLCQ